MAARAQKCLAEALSIVSVMCNVAVLGISGDRCGFVTRLHHFHGTSSWLLGTPNSEWGTGDAKTHGRWSAFSLILLEHGLLFFKAGERTWLALAAQPFRLEPFCLILFDVLRFRAQASA